MTIRIPVHDRQPHRHIDGGFGGQELLGEDDGDHGHQMTPMTPSATNISISPMLEPTQEPELEPRCMPSRQCRRKYHLSGVSS